MIFDLVEAAVHDGARLKPACETIGLSARTLQRWRRQGIGEDCRRGPRSAPPNKLSAAERQEVLEVVNSPEYCDLSPNQIVPRLADEGRYLASEATMYRILREEALLAHRERSRPAVIWRTREHLATGPNQVWSWDITYLPSSVRGRWYYLYMVVDVWSRKIVGWNVHVEESGQKASLLARAAMMREDAWLKNRIKVQVNITNPADPSFFSYHVMGILPIPDNIMRDHRKIAFYDVRHLVRPGLTGWAQVKYRYGATEQDAFEKLQYEFYYLRRQGLSLDLRIVFRTVRRVLARQGH